MGARTDVQVHESIGSVTGTVEKIAIRPRPHFSLRDRTTDRLVKIFVAECDLQQIVQAFGRDVVVVGRLRRRADGVALDMREVRELRILPTAEELPPPEAFLGAVSDLMGGLTFDEYLDHIRGSDDE